MSFIDSLKKEFDAIKNFFNPSSPIENRFQIEREAAEQKAAEIEQLNQEKAARQKEELDSLYEQLEELKREIIKRRELLEFDYRELMRESKSGNVSREDYAKRISEIIEEDAILQELYEQNFMKYKPVVK